MKNLLTTILLLAMSLTMHAQDPLDPGWLWAERGGNPAGLIGSSDYLMERVVDIAVDSDNNYYYLAEVGGMNFTYGDMEFETYNDFANRRDIFVFSTDEIGTFRWSKTIGGGFHDIGATFIGIDENDFVYVSGTTANIEGNTPVHFDTDSIMPEGTNNDPGPNNKSAFLIKYDGDGNFQWLRQPEGNQAPVFGSATTLSTLIEPNGTTHNLISFRTGTHLDGELTVAPDSSKAAILKYAANGDLLSFITFEMTPRATLPYNYLLAYDANLDRYYIGDTYRITPDPENPLSINGFGAETVDKGFYLAAIDSEGEVIWYQENEKLGSFRTGDLQLDGSGNIYFAGRLNMFTDPDSFAGYVFETPPNEPALEAPFLIKLDSEGNLIWGTNALLTSPFNPQSIVVAGNNVYLGLGMVNNTWDSLEIPGPVLQGLVPDIQIIRFDAETGTAQEVIHNNAITPTRDAIMAMAMDGNGDLIVGGYFGSTLFGGTDLQLTDSGTDSDFFIAKYSPQGTGVGGIAGQSIQDLHIFPNPSMGMLYLQGELTQSGSPMGYSLYDLQGRTIEQGQVRGNQIDLTGTEGGVFLLKVSCGGREMVFKVVKN